MSDEKVMPKLCEKVACEVCGKMVTSSPAGRAAHMRVHAKAEYIAPSTKEEPEVQEPKATTTVKSNLKEEDQKIVERALAAQESFRQAPQVFLSDDTTDNNMALVNLYAPDALDKFDSNGKLKSKAKRHAFFAARDKLAQWASRGYVPQVGDNGEFVANEGGDVLCTCDREMFEARERRAQNESASILKSLRSKKSGANIRGAEDIPMGDAGDLQNVSLSVGQEEIQL